MALHASSPSPTSLQKGHPAEALSSLCVSLLCSVITIRAAKKKIILVALRLFRSKVCISCVCPTILLGTRNAVVLHGFDFKDILSVLEEWKGQPWNLCTGNHILQFDDFLLLETP
jgi:hypothetical protein